MEEKLLVADVGLDPRSVGAEAIYTYLATPETQVGQACFVTLGPRQALGFVLAVREVVPSELAFPASQLKPLGAKVDGLDLPPAVIDLVHEVSRQTLSSIPSALNLAVPPGSRDRIATRWRLTDAGRSADLGELTPAQQKVVQTLADGEEIVEVKGKPASKGLRSTLLALRRRGLVEQSMGLSPLAERRRLTGMLRLTPNAAAVEGFLAGEGKRRPAQAFTLMQLQGSESASFTVEELRTLGGVTDATLRALLAAGLLEQIEEGAIPARQAPTPNPTQQAAIDAIGAAVRDSRAEAFLLYGVTGSGKTEVYLRAAAETLKWGRQVLYLVPEIALTAQVVAQLRERFGKRVAVMHSNMTPPERLASWLKVRSGEAPVVLGARSAIFAPFTNLGLVVVDEEHEASYKQESTPRYHARSLALWLAQRFGAPIVLGSATPSIESYHAALEGRMTLLSLPERAAHALLPTVFVEDLTESYKQGHPTIFSSSLHRRIAATITNGKQVILFLNRRAYAPFLLCRDCGHRFLCPNCAVSLAYHRRERKLRCHHCDFSQPAPDICPSCEGTRVAPFGVGGERVEEEVRIWFPDAEVARLDRDIARRKGALEETLGKFRSGATQVLVGTQMVAKGLDFPNVTLVGVVAADLSLNLPDFRASERTFQLLSQVSGRAGRGRSPGEVVIQTMAPDDRAVACAQTHDFEGFYAQEILDREAAGYPPFVRLVNVLAAGESRRAVMDLSAQAADRLRAKLSDAMVLGPADCAIERLQNLWRRHVLVKLQPDADPTPVLDALDGLSADGARLTIDVDPSTLI